MFASAAGFRNNGRLLDQMCMTRNKQDEYCYVCDDVTCRPRVMGTTKEFCHEGLSLRETLRYELRDGTSFP